MVLGDAVVTTAAPASLGGTSLLLGGLWLSPRRVLILAFVRETPPVSQTLVGGSSSGHRVPNHLGWEQMRTPKRAVYQAKGLVTDVSILKDMLTTSSLSQEEVHDVLPKGRHHGLHQDLQGFHLLILNHEEFGQGEGVKGSLQARTGREFR